MFVVNFTDGKSMLFESYDEWQASPYASKEFSTTGEVEKYDPNEMFTRYWVIVELVNDKVTVQKQGTDSWRLSDKAWMQRDSLMYGAWNISYFSKYSAFGAGDNYAEAVMYATKAISKLCE